MIDIFYIFHVITYNPIEVIKMKRINKVGFLLCLCGLLFSGKEIVKIYHEYHVGKKIYHKLEGKTKIKEENDAVDLDVNFDELKKINNNCIGWIYIPNTKINYPLVQAEDNQFWLNHAFDGTKNTSGSIFVSKRNNGFLNQNTIVYGHNKKDGSMFADLHKYENATFAKENPFVYIKTENRLTCYKVFSAHATMDGSDVYTCDFTKTAFQKYINVALTKSQIENGDISISASDKIITLSTCMSRGIKLERFVVQAVRV